MEEKKDRSLLEALEAYGTSDYYPLHMPGHKRRMGYFDNLFSIDITEIDGFDNLFHAEGILLEAQRRAARLFGAEETYYLVNGSTCGILAAVSAAVPRGGHILMARNCHKAAYHAVLLNGLRATYLYPKTDTVRGINGVIAPEDVSEALEQQKDIRAVLITSPTYDGVVSDLRSIAERVHRAGAILIVDGAHGAHFGMHPYFPESALSCGADIVINSLHKTLPSPTQTALLHVRGRLADRERLRKYLGIYQSSSPSYVMMAAMDECIRLLERDGDTLFAQFTKRLECMRSVLKKMKVLHLVDGQEVGIAAFDFDRSKVLISTERSRLTGPMLSDLLRREYHMEVEMEAEQYVTAIFTIADTEEGFARFWKALLAIDEQLEACGEETAPEENMGCWRQNEEVLTIAAAENEAQMRVPLQNSSGKVSAEYAYLYPPGIPLLVPGERISDTLVEQLEDYRKVGLKVQGLSDYTGRTILVVKEMQSLYDSSRTHVRLGARFWSA